MINQILCVVIKKIIYYYQKNYILLSKKGIYTVLRILTLLKNS